MQIDGINECAAPINNLCDPLIACIKLIHMHFRLDVYFLHTSRKIMQNRECEIRITMPIVWRIFTVAFCGAPSNELNKCNQTKFTIAMAGYQELLTGLDSTRLDPQAIAAANDSLWKSHSILDWRLHQRFICAQRPSFVCRLFVFRTYFYNAHKRFHASPFTPHIQIGSAVGAIRPRSGDTTMNGTASTTAASSRTHICRNIAQTTANHLINVKLFHNWVIEIGCFQWKRFCDAKFCWRTPRRSSNASMV